MFAWIAWKKLMWLHNEPDFNTLFQGSEIENEMEFQKRSSFLLLYLFWGGGTHLAEFKDLNLF